MAPFLVAGQRIRVQPCNITDLQRGDLVAFDASHRIVLHRVLSIDLTSGRFVEKGDNARQATQVDAAHLLGRAVKIVAPEVVDLTTRRYRLAGRVLGFCSQVHGAVHRVSANIPAAGRLFRGTATLAVRAVGFWLRPR
jgi:hypothetical protein